MLAQAGQEAARIRGQLRQIVAAAPHHAKPITYYYELDQTYYSVTSDTFVGQLLGLLGMKSIADQAKGAASSGGYPQLSAEYILKANPDYIILADTICCHQDAATVAKRPGWSALAAVKDGSRHRAERRHRLALGAAGHRPAAHRRDHPGPGLGTVKLAAR